MSAIDLIRKTITGNESAASLRIALESLDQEIGCAQRDLAFAQSGFGDSVLSGGASLAKSENAIATKRRELDQLHAARVTLERKLADADAKERGKALVERWRDCEKKLQKRHAAFDRLEDIARSYASALQEAADAATVAWEALPVRSVPATEHAAEITLWRDFLLPELIDRAKLEIDMAVARMQIAAAGEGNPSGVDSSIFTLLERPGLAALSRKAADYWLSLQATSNAA